MNRSVATRLLIVGSLALAVRLLFFAWNWTGWCVEPQNLLSSVYFEQGYALCAGRGYIRPTGYLNIPWLQNLAQIAQSHRRVTADTAGPVDEAEIRPEMLHPPGMAVLVAAIHFLSGDAVDVPVQLLGACLDTAAACLLYAMVATFFSARVGFCAGILYGVWPPLAYFSAVSRTPEGLQPVFVIACLACVLQGTRYDRWKRAAWLVASALLLAVSCYLRPDYLLMPIVLSAFPHIWSSISLNFRSAAMSS